VPPINGQNKYQVLPSLKPEERSALKESIRAEGIREPIVMDVQGNIIDGHTRYALYQELVNEEGCTLPPLPKKVYHAEKSDAEKRTMARELNAGSKGRHLNKKQVKELLIAQLKDTPERSNRWIARIIGCGKSMTNAARQELEKTDPTFPYIDRLVSEDDKEGPSRKGRAANPSGVVKNMLDRKAQEQTDKDSSTGKEVRRPGAPPSPPPSASAPLSSDPTLGETLGEDPMDEDVIPSGKLTKEEEANWDMGKWLTRFEGLSPEAVGEACPEIALFESNEERLKHHVEWCESYRQAARAKFKTKLHSVK
jgi:hypothetical protein